LQVVDAIIRVPKVVRCYTIVVEVNAEVAIVVNQVSEDAAARAGLNKVQDVDAPAAIKRDNVALGGGSSADGGVVCTRQSIAADPDAVSMIRHRRYAVRRRPDKITLDHIVRAVDG